MIYVTAGKGVKSSFLRGLLAKHAGRGLTYWHSRNASPNRHRTIESSVLKTDDFELRLR